jgi:hypothetical protein
MLAVAPVPTRTRPPTTPRKSCNAWPRRFELGEGALGVLEQDLARAGVEARLPTRSTRAKPTFSSS